MILRRMKAQQWAWLHLKLALGFGWTTAMLFVTPTTLRDGLEVNGIAFWTIGTALGALVSIIGMVMSMAIAIRTKLLGLTIEFIGLILFAGGPLQYFAIQVSQLGTDFQDRYALSWFAYCMLAAVLVRLVAVVVLLLQNAAAHDAESKA